MTQCLNGKVTELQHLRTQNEAIERKLLNIHTLFSQGQEGARSIIDGQAESSGSDHEIHEEATTADAREQEEKEVQVERQAKVPPWKRKSKAKDVEPSVRPYKKRVRI